MAFPILTDRGRHWARKLRNKHQILCDMNQPNQLHADYSQRWKGEERRERVSISTINVLTVALIDHKWMHPSTPDPKS